MTDEERAETQRRIFAHRMSAAHYRMAAAFADMAAESLEQALVANAMGVRMEQQAAVAETERIVAGG